jgi:hypothetical protein
VSLLHLVPSNGGARLPGAELKMSQIICPTLYMVLETIGLNCWVMKCVYLM